MFVRVRFTIPFLISYIQLATRSFVLSFCGLVSFFFLLFPLSLFPFHLHTYMYVYMYTCKHHQGSLPSYLSDIATSTLLLHLSIVRTYVYT